MNRIRFVLLSIILSPMVAGAQAPAPEPPKDQWAALPKYQEANAKLAPPAAGEKRIIFFGDSITEAWANDKEHFFPGKGYIGPGISGQTTTQMLVRFRQDVIDLHPTVVLILAGTNDIAENLGPTSLHSIEDNLQSMAELATANGVKPVLCSVLPAFEYPWHKGLNPPPKVAALNDWIKAYCDKTHIVYLNYFPALVDQRQGMRAELSGDGIHPNGAGYAVMEPLAEEAIRQALNKS